MENDSHSFLNIISAIGYLAGLVAMLAGTLVMVNRRFAVKEDKRIKQVEEMLPLTNCGACGYPGCHAFAEALIKQETEPGKCNVSPIDAKQRIAEFLNITVGQSDKLVARLSCAGGNNVARYQTNYVGQQSCQSASQVSGGAKACVWGCLGFGDCKTACRFNAIHMNKQALPIIDETLCTGCGDCVDACPKDLFSLESMNHRLWVACKNLLAGDQLLESCEVACTACGRCAMDSNDELITMHNNLPQINYNIPCDTQIPIQRCPTGAIVWINTDGSVTKGRESKKIVRHTSLPLVGT